MTNKGIFKNYINNITLDLSDKDKYYLFDFIQFEQNEEIFVNILKTLLTYNTQSSCNDTLLKNLVNTFNESIFMYIFKSRLDITSKESFDLNFKHLNLLLIQMYKSIISDIKRK